MNSNTQQLKLPNQVVLASNKSALLTYRLTLPSRVYQRGKSVLAQIDYREGNKNIRVLQSNLEAVAFMIP